MLNAPEYAALRDSGAAGAPGSKGTSGKLQEHKSSCFLSGFVVAPASDAAHGPINGEGGLLLCFRPVVLSELMQEGDASRLACRVPRRSGTHIVGERRSSLSANTRDTSSFGLYANALCRVEGKLVATPAFWCGLSLTLLGVADAIAIGNRDFRHTV